MKKSVKIAIISTVAIICLIAAILCILKIVKNNRKPNLEEVTIDTINSEGALQEEKMFSALLRITEEYSAPWSFEDATVSIEYTDSKTPIFVLESEEYTYKFELTEDFVLYKIWKLGVLDQGDLDFGYNYGGIWSVETQGLWQIYTMDILSYGERDTESTSTFETESERIGLQHIEYKHPLEVKEDVDISDVTREDMRKENVTEETSTYAHSLYLVESEVAPWFNKNYTVQLIDAEDDALEILITLNNIQYRLRTDSGGLLYRFYKNSPFTEEDMKYLVQTGGSWEDTEMVDSWYVVYRTTYTFPE